MDGNVDGRIEQNNFIVDGRTLWKNLEIKVEFNHWMPRKIKQWGFVEGIDYKKFIFIDNNPSPKKEYILTKKTAEILQGIYRGEVRFLYDLKEIFKDIAEIIPQYIVKKYKIDFYIPAFNLAIEYDEDGHNCKLKEDKIRETFIKYELNCHIIRVKSGKETLGLNEILKFLLLNQREDKKYVKECN